MKLASTLIALTLFASITASATTFTVNTTNDTVDANVGNNVCADAAGKCSLRAAVMQANAKAGSDTINLPAGTFKLSTLGAAEDACLTGDLDVFETLTVIGDGSGQTVIDGLNSDRIFDVLPIIGTPAFKVQGVQLTKGAFLGGGGGAIQMSSIGKTTLVDTLINANVASTGGGLATPGAVTIQDSVFENNQATSIAGAIAKLGAGDLLITNSRFENNSGASAGGAIYAAGAVDTFQFTDSEFINNTCMGQGGAMLLAFTGPLKIDGTNFTGNSSQIGGAVMSAGSITSVTVTDSEFTDNFAISAASAAYLIHTAKARVTNSSFTSNSVFSGPAALILAGGTPVADIEITNTTISDNSSSTGPAGGLYALAGGSMKITGSTFNDNKDNSGGAAIFGTASGNLTIADSEFLRNSGGTGPGGAAYLAAGGTATFLRTTFGANQNNVGGGGAYLSAPVLNINESVFFNNTSTSAPGGGLIFAGNGSIRNTTFSGNTAIGGAGLYGSGNVTMTNATFSENTSSVPGSAVFWSGGTLTVKNSVLADKFGGDLCSGATFASAGNNVFEDPSCGFALGSDELTANAALFALDDNGGNTFTHALGGSSPALDKFTGNGCPSIDQRGQARPFDGDDDGSARCDSGAFESHDLCPNDPSKLEPGVCGCDTPDLDSNNNGIIDCLADQDLEAQAIALRKLVSKFQATDSGKKRKNKRSAIKKALADLVGFSSVNSSGITVQGASTLDTLVGKVNNKVKKALKNDDPAFLDNKTRAKKAIKKLLTAVVVSVG